MVDSNSSPRSPSLHVLVVTPDLALLGGVANYFAVLRRYLSNCVRFFVVGRRAEEPAGLSAVCRALLDLLRYAGELVTGDYQIVHLNPSLAPKVLFREAVFCGVAKLLGKRVLVFMHG